MNKYISVHVPGHHRANINGFVAEHIIVAEQKLGRELSDSEVVHHVDGNKMNNSPDNLMIFRSKSDHTLFHKNGVAYNNNGVWFCKKRKYKAICEQCGKVFIFPDTRKIRNHIYCSQACAREGKKILPCIDVIIIDIKKENGNFSAVGRKYDVSPNAIVKLLKSNNLPYHSKDYRVKKT